MTPNFATSSTEITDLCKLIDATNEVIGVFDGDSAFWRGHAAAHWSLLPQVFRLREEGQPPYYESALIGHFVSRAPSRGHMSMPTVEAKLEWLFLAQHYRLPTRLLDWSDSPLIAAYFSVTDKPGEKSEPEECDGCLWALRPGGLNQHFGSGDGLVRMTHPTVAEIADHAYSDDSSCDAAILALDGREIDRRMLAQMGRFTIHGYPGPIDSLPNSRPWLQKFTIPSKAKNKI